MEQRFATAHGASRGHAAHPHEGRALQRQNRWQGGDAYAIGCWRLSKKQSSKGRLLANRCCALAYAGQVRAPVGGAGGVTVLKNVKARRRNCARRAYIQKLQCSVPVGADQLLGTGFVTNYPAARIVDR